jgi:hypothetical protein
MSSKVKLELTKEDSFVLLELLARYVHDGGALVAENEIEIATIRTLCQSLDDELVELFRTDYKKFVQHRSKSGKNEP